jgi:hypothetical protein
LAWPQRPSKTINLVPHLPRCPPDSEPDFSYRHARPYRYPPAFTLAGGRLGPLSQYPPLHHQCLVRAAVGYCLSPVDTGCTPRARRAEKSEAKAEKSEIKGQKSGVGLRGWRGLVEGSYGHGGSVRGTSGATRGEKRPWGGPWGKTVEKRNRRAAGVQGAVTATPGNAAARLHRRRKKTHGTENASGHSVAW